MEQLQSIANGVTMICAVILGVVAAVFGLVEYAREDGFDPELRKLPKSQWPLVRNVGAIGVALMLLGILNKAVFFLGLCCFEAALIFWFLNRVPTQPPKLH